MYIYIYIYIKKEGQHAVARWCGCFFNASPTPRNGRVAPCLQRLFYSVICEMARLRGRHGEGQHATPLA